jgi:thymidylate kinase
MCLPSLVFWVYTALYESVQKYLAPRIAGPIVLCSKFTGSSCSYGCSQNWDDHDRSGKSTAVAMAKTYLTSCDPNAILLQLGITVPSHFGT